MSGGLNDIMKYFVKIVSNIAVQIYRTDKKWSESDHELTEEQIVNLTLPCHAEVTSDGVVFGDVVPWSDVPNMGVPVEGNADEPVEPEPEAPENTEVSWDEMAAAIMEGVNDV